MRLSYNTIPSPAEAGTFGHAYAAEYHARDKVVVPCHGDEASQVRLLMTEPQPGAGRLAGEATTLGLWP